jgi:parallel beta-helix repeat protein
MTHGSVNMMHVSQRLGVTALLAVVLFAVAPLPVYAQADPVTGPWPSINCDAEGVSLQKKIDNVSEGSLIYFTGSCDDGPYFIGPAFNGGQRTDRVTLWGHDGATLSAPSGSNHVLQASGVHVTLRNFRIMADSTQIGIVLEGTSALIWRVVVENAVVHGLHVGSSSFARIYESQFRNNGVGIFVGDGSTASLGDNKVENNRSEGVYVLTNSNASFGTDNIIRGNVNGLRVDFLSSLVLHGGSFIEWNTGAGILVDTRYASLLLRSPNTIQNNGTDVICYARALVSVDQPQNSSTKTTDITPGCEVLNPPIF